MKARTQTHEYSPTTPSFQSVFNYDLLIKLNKTFILYLSIVETSSGNKLLPPYNMVVMTTGNCNVLDVTCPLL